VCWQEENLQEVGFERDAQIPVGLVEEEGVAGDDCPVPGRYDTTRFESVFAKEEMMRLRG
jgi:hypothetical protein